MGRIKACGIIEGFYGTPWSYEDRIDMLAFCKNVGLNTYIYAPKDDPYHRELWRAPYPSDIADKLRVFVETARKNGVNFIFAISPGKDLRYGENAFEIDVQTVVHKFQNAYDIGFRQFAVFFDDVECGDGAKQAELLNIINRELVRARDCIAPLITVPTEYFIENMFAGGRVKPYTAAFSKELDTDIVVLFTGREVCPDGLKQEDIDVFKGIYGDRPIGLWWNYPVNDYLPNKPALGPLDQMDARNGFDYFFMNPMNKPEISKISLYTGAAYARDTENYDEDAEWNKAIELLFGNVSSEMKLFASEHQRLEGRSAHIGRADAPELSGKYLEFRANTGIHSANELIDELQKYLAAYEILRSRLSDKILKEIESNLRIQKRRKEKDLAALQAFVPGKMSREEALLLLQRNQEESEACYVTKELFPI